MHPKKANFYSLKANCRTWNVSLSNRTMTPIVCGSSCTNSPHSCWPPASTPDAVSEHSCKSLGSTFSWKTVGLDRLNLCIIKPCDHASHLDARGVNHLTEKNRWALTRVWEADEVLWLIACAPNRKILWKHQIPGSPWILQGKQKKSWKALYNFEWIVVTWRECNGVFDSQFH